MSELLAALQSYGQTVPAKTSTSSTIPPPADQLDALTAQLAIAGAEPVAIPPQWYIGQPWGGPERNPITSYADALRSRLCACKGGDGTYVWVGQVAWGTPTVAMDAAGKETKTYPYNGVIVKSVIPKAAKVADEFKPLQAK